MSNALRTLFAMAFLTAEPGVAGTGEAPAAAPAAEAKPAAAPKIKAHGVTRPAAGTKTGRVWEISDELSKAAGKPIPRKDVMEKGEKEGINPATIATQYGKWRVFNGLKGVVTIEPKPPKAPKTPKAPAAGAEAPVVEGAAAAPAGAAPAGA
jgi:hypothetical protein